MEIIVLPAEEGVLIDDKDVVRNDPKMGVDSLMGILGDDDITLEPIREERLNRYESTH